MIETLSREIFRLSHKDATRNKTEAASTSASSRALKVLLIAPPYGPLEMPSLGLHSLQSVARQSGHVVSILYSNIQFASCVGVAIYREASSTAYRQLVCGQLFGPLAFARPDTASKHLLGNENYAQLESLVERSRGGVEAVLNEIVDLVEKQSFDVVGCTTTFDQTIGALAILNRVKEVRPNVITILGGANCEAEMANGLASITPSVDFIFSGEAETSFITFLEELRQAVMPSSKVIQGELLGDLDQLPCPEYDDYFKQVGDKLPAEFRSTSWISYECSRGCWWGKKHHCRFCGLNGRVMDFRAKSAGKVEAELWHLATKWEVNRICMTDNIIPIHYYRDLFPLLHKWEKPLEIFFELKPTATLRDLNNLASAGVRTTQMGIETLSTRLLRLLDKGGSARQNILALRNAQICGINVIWNFLHQIPGESECDYDQILELIPAIVHLEPPQMVATISIDRFSPYFDRPAEFGIRNIRPKNFYNGVYPAQADLMEVAYHFDGDYQACNEPASGTLNRVLLALDAWQARWREVRRPYLTVLPLTEEEFLLVDTRQRANQIFLSLNRAEAEFCLFGQDESDRTRNFCIDHKLVLELDGRLVPLAVTDKVTASRLNSAQVDLLA